MATTFIEYNYCAKDYFDENGKCHLILVDDAEVGLIGECIEYTKIEDCSDSAYLGMTYNDYQFMQGITGNLIGFTIVFLVGLMFAFQGRK